MNVFLTGASGLLGSHVARDLLLQNYSITALKRPHSDFSLISDVSPRVNWIEGNVFDINLLEYIIAQVDYVIHCAAIVSFSPNDKTAMYKTNVEGTQNIVNAIINTGCKAQLIHISSVAALGRKQNSKVIDEENVWENSPHNTHYAITKYLSELEVWRGIEEGLQAVILNPSLIIGPGNWNGGSTKIFKYVYDEKPFYPAGTVNYIDVRDVVTTINFFLKTKFTNDRYIVSADSVDYKKLFDTIAFYFKKKPPRIKTNSFINELAWRVEYIRSLITGSTPIVSKETANISKLSVHFKNDKIKKLSGINFKTLNESVEWTCKNLMERYCQH
ncbi:MAG: NAD-dependent epimerase/dehydratase family protein [Cytophagaceae bacterium]|nr:NAD-dependent epimerase/dehydratase family protein [Cytophagaceae bacterium]MDW8456904.1 NAD-dependent epimerase/dehydratase family protein [Cytophagaceae bacterium]